MDPYVKAFRDLRRARVPFIVVGAFGVNLHAQRAGLFVNTADCDLLLPPDPKVLSRAVKALRRRGFAIEAGNEPLPDEDPVVLKGIVGARACVRAHLGDTHIDLPLSIAGYDFSSLQRKKVRFKVQTVLVSVAPLEDILHSKELAGRPKDRTFLETYRDALEQLLRPKPLPRRLPPKKR